MRLPRMVAALGLAVIATAHAAGADEPRDRPLGVVELFTSQGCNSCPPADAVLADIARSGEAIALAYHVDYWDYLGWKDTLGSKRNTKRQKEYAAALGKSAYTPQIVVNGRRNVIGSDAAAVEEALRTMAKAQDGPRVDISFSGTADSIIVRTGAAKGAEPREAHVVLVSFVPRQVVKVQRGENRGRSIEYRNAVTDYQAIGMWHGKPARYELPRSEFAGKGCAVLLQAFDDRGRPGAILGAAVMPQPAG